MFARPFLSLLIIGLFEAGTSRGASSGNEQQANTLSKQKKELVKVCKESIEALMQEVESGRRLPSEDLCIWSRRWLQAKLAVTRKKAGKVGAYKEHLQHMKAVEKSAKRLVDLGKTSVITYTTAKYYRLQAEIWLAQARSTK
jgi:hypothetical protein